MKLVVGLGNPGREYLNSRHNIGFIFIDGYAEKNNIEIKKKKFNGLYEEISINNIKIILLKPQSYMNLSGEIVRQYVDYFKISIRDILIISDDLDMEFSRIRLRKNGSCGGHNGLRNIEHNLNTKEYKRLKIGIANDKSIDTKDYVLGSFSKEETKYLDILQEKVNNIIDDFLVLDFEDVMYKYNHNGDINETIR